MGSSSAACDGARWAKVSTAAKPPSLKSTPNHHHQSPPITTTIHQQPQQQQQSVLPSLLSLSPAVNASSQHCCTSQLRDVQSNAYWGLMEQAGSLASVCWEAWPSTMVIIGSPALSVTLQPATPHTTNPYHNRSKWDHLAAAPCSLMAHVLHVLVTSQKRQLNPQTCLECCI